MSHQSQLTPTQNKFHQGNGEDGKHYWITPPALYAELDAEFNFDFDPCPFPLPAGFDGLTCEWGYSNYVNPPFGSIMHQGKKKGPTAWVRKAIEEQAKGKSVVLVYPVDKWVLMLLSAIGTEVRNLGDVRWLSTEDSSAGKGTGRHIACFILRAAQARRSGARRMSMLTDEQAIKIEVILTKYQMGTLDRQAARLKIGDLLSISPEPPQPDYDALYRAIVHQGNRAGLWKTFAQEVIKELASAPYECPTAQPAPENPAPASLIDYERFGEGDNWNNRHPASPAAPRLPLESEVVEEMAHVGLTAWSAGERSWNAIMTAALRVAEKWLLNQGGQVSKWRVIIPETEFYLEADDEGDALRQVDSSFSVMRDARAEEIIDDKEQP